MLIQRQVDKYLTAKGDELKSIRSIIRYYVSMVITCKLLKKASAPTDKDLAGLVPIISKALPDAYFEYGIVTVQLAYLKFGETETIAKGPDMRDDILKELKAALTPAGPLGL